MLVNLKWSLDGKIYFKLNFNCELSYSLFNGVGQRVCIGTTVTLWPACSPALSYFSLSYLVLYCYTLSIEAAGLSKIVVTFYQTALHHIPKDCHLDLVSNIMEFNCY
jgi:hypothetical protein